MRSIIWSAGRVASQPEESASFAISSVSLPQNPTALTCPNACSTLTDRLACLRGGGGKRGTWMNGEGEKIPILRLAGRAHCRSAVLPRYFGGRYRVPFSNSYLLFLSLLSGAPRFGPLDSLVLYSAFFQKPKKTPRPLLRPQAPQAHINVRPSLLYAEEQERPPCIYWILT